MNARVQELADQARAGVTPGLPVDEWIREYNQKFAELIVRECIGCCEQVISDPVPESVDTWLNGGEQCVQEIKEHFGIKE